METAHLPQTPNDAASRDAFVESWLILVEAIARATMRTLPPSFEYDDLHQAGAIGLLQAMDSFDAARGVPFRAYATLRIRGAILDSIRRRHYRNATHLPITEQVAEMPGTGAETIERQVERAQQAAVIERAKEGLQPNERKVIEIYFEQDGKLDGIGAALGVKQSRSSQVLQMAKRSMKRELEWKGVKAA